MYTKDEDLYKAISVGKLRTILAEFPDNYLVSVSPVREIAILDAAEQYKGFIALGDEEYSSWEGVQ